VNESPRLDEGPAQSETLQLAAICMGIAASPQGFTEPYIRARLTGVASELRRLHAVEASRTTARTPRKAEKLLREVLEAMPGLQAVNCLGRDLHERVCAVVDAAPEPVPVASSAVRAEPETDADLLGRLCAADALTPGLPLASMLRDDVLVGDYQRRLLLLVRSTHQPQAAESVPAVRLTDDELRRAYSDAELGVGFIERIRAVETLVLQKNGLRLGEL